MIEDSAQTSETVVAMMRRPGRSSPSNMVSRFIAACIEWIMVEAANLRDRGLLESAVATAAATFWRSNSCTMGFPRWPPRTSSTFARITLLSMATSDVAVVAESFLDLNSHFVATDKQLEALTWESQMVPYPKTRPRRSSNSM